MAFFVVDADGDLLLPVLGMRFEGVVNRVKGVFDGAGSAGKYDGRVFLIEATGRACGGLAMEFVGRSL